MWQYNQLKEIFFKTNIPERHLTQILYAQCVLFISLLKRILTGCILQVYVESHLVMRATWPLLKRSAPLSPVSTRTTCPYSSGSASLRLLKCNRPYSCMSRCSFSNRVRLSPGQHTGLQIRCIFLIL